MSTTGSAIAVGLSATDSEAANCVISTTELSEGSTSSTGVAIGAGAAIGSGSGVATAVSTGVCSIGVVAK